MRIGVIIAMDKEFSLVCGALSPIQDGGSIMGCLYRIAGICENTEVVLLRCGIGKTNAAVGAMLLRWHFRADLIVSTGVAGGTHPYIKQGSFIAGSSYSYHDVYCGAGTAYGAVQGEPSRFDADTKMLNILVETFRDVQTGMIVSGDQFINQKEKMGRILDLFPSAVAVDMESASVAHVCSKPLSGKTTPFIALRMISDCLFDTDAKDYDEFWKVAPTELSERTVELVRKLPSEY